MNELGQKRQRLCGLRNAETQPKKCPKYLDFPYGLH